MPWDLDVSLALHWETSPLQEAEVFVSENGGAEKLVQRGTNGSCELDWIQPGVDYDFRLYRTQSPRQLLYAVSVRREPIPWKSLLKALNGTNNSDQESEDIADFVAGAVTRCLGDARFPDWFREWEKSGFHVTPVHFYQPIPDTGDLGGVLWKEKRELVGMDWNHQMQVELLRDVFPRYRQELSAIPRDREQANGGFYVNNGRFERLDPLIAYCMVRHFQPRRIIEVGGGYSTLLLSLAASKNGETSLTCIEPYPEDFLLTMSGLEVLHKKKVQEMALSFFERLEAGDLLFIDSSHVVRIGGDVNFLFQEILPRLKPGVIVHLHDIFLPYEYPKKWVMQRHYFWTEQYLLQAFFSFNTEFEILLTTCYLAAYCREELEAVFPNPPEPAGGSFWMRRKG
ncbi:MAG: class I SAM-dependent methyltransferase [Chthoniobacterales bacterium]|nr:class I SAM-dependent methyltransferase [Chthoniobacterales bacterium]